MQRSPVFAGAVKSQLSRARQVCTCGRHSPRTSSLMAASLSPGLLRIFTLTGAVAPLLMAMGFDRTGSYQAPLLFFLLATLISIILMLRLGPCRFSPAR